MLFANQDLLSLCKVSDGLSKRTKEMKVRTLAAPTTVHAKITDKGDVIAFLDCAKIL